MKRVRDLLQSTVNLPYWMSVKKNTVPFVKH